jgi:cytochrome c553
MMIFGFHGVFVTVPAKTGRVMRMYRLFAVIFQLLIFSAAAQAAVPGQTEYAVCVACHGASGEGNVSLKAPALAAQDADYLARQLRHFKSGVRGGEPKDVFGAQMRGMAGTLATEQAITDVSAYIAAMPPVPVAAAPGDANLRNGENLYNGACGACHGGRAQGNPALNSPRLSGLDAAYLKRQYRNYGAGIRGSHADDRYGKQMKMMSGMLPSEKDLDDVIAFILANSQAQ